MRSASLLFVILLLLQGESAQAWDKKQLPKYRKPAATKPSTKAKKSKAKSTVKNVAPPVKEAEQKSEVKEPVVVSDAPKPVVAAEIKERMDDAEVRHYSFRVGSYLGVLVAAQSGMIFGLNLGIAPGPESSWYFGPEINYTNPAGGSLMSALLGAWREIPVYGASRLSLGLGVLGGPVFAAAGTGYSSVTYAGYFNVSLCKEIDELAVLRAEFRPGVIAGRFAFLMNFGVSFRFL